MAGMSPVRVKVGEPSSGARVEMGGNLDYKDLDPGEVKLVPTVAEIGLRQVVISGGPSPGLYTLLEVRTHSGVSVTFWPGGTLTAIGQDMMDLDAACAAGVKLDRYWHGGEEQGRDGALGGNTGSSQGGDAGDVYRHEGTLAASDSPAGDGGG